MLSSVGHPHAVNPDAGLSDVAEEREWPVLFFESRTPPDLSELLEPLRSHPLRYAFYRTLPTGFHRKRSSQTGSLF